MLLDVIYLSQSKPDVLHFRSSLFYYNSVIVYVIAIPCGVVEYDEHDVCLVFILVYTEEDIIIS